MCQLPAAVLSDMVRYVLWLLECSHDSGRCNAVMFCVQAFPFRVLLDLFDAQDGLRKLVNAVSTSSLLPLRRADQISNWFRGGNLCVAGSRNSAIIHREFSEVGSVIFGLLLSCAHASADWSARKPFVFLIDS